MSAIPALLARLTAKDRINVIGIASDDIKQGGFASGLEVSYACFDHMTCTVEFMSMSKIGPSLVWLDDSIVWVEVAIWLLCGGDTCDHCVKQGIEAWIWVCC